MSHRTVFRRSAMAALGVVTALATSSCARPATPGEADPGSSEATTPNPQASGKQFNLKDPKNLKGISNACTLLTTKQLKQLRAATEGKQDTTAYGGPSCVWSNDNFSAAIGINTKTGMGPEEIYRQNKGNGTPTQVSGYPAYFVGKTTILCRVEVGVAKEQSFTINYAKYSGDAPAMQDPCGYAKKIAAEVLKNVPDA